ncbi:recombinase family protein [Vibrio cyclitrophicus]
MNTYGYIRVSTEEQKKSEKTGVQRQLKFINECAKSLGCDNPIIIDDTGMSAHASSSKKKTNITHGKLRKFLDDVANGKHNGDVFIVEDMDRLSRDNDAGTLALIQMRQGGVTVHTKDGVQGKELVSSLLTTVKLALAQQESDAKSHKIKGAYREKIRRAKAGEKTPFNQIPHYYYWDKVKKDYFYHDYYKQAVNRAVDLYLDGHGYGYIAKVLQDEGYKGSTRKSSEWLGSHVSTLLHHKSLHGDFHINGETIVNMFPKMMSDEKYTKLKLALSQREKFGRGGQKFGQTLITALGGITRCGDCHGAVVKNRDRFGRYVLKCPVCSRGASKEGRKASALLEYIEEKVFAVLAFDFKPHMNKTDSDVDDRINSVLVDIKAKESSIQTYFDMMEKDSSLAAMVGERVGKLNNKIKDLKSNLNQLELEKSAEDIDDDVYIKLIELETDIFDKKCQESIALARTYISKLVNRIEVFFNGQDDYKNTITVTVELKDNTTFEIELCRKKKDAVSLIVRNEMLNNGMAKLL